MSMQIKAAKLTSQGGMAGRVRSGDPGLFGTLGKLAGGAVGFLTGGPAGAVAGYKGVSALLGGSKSTQPRMPGVPQSFPVTPTPGFTGMVQRLAPGGATGYQVNAPAGAVSGKPPAGYRYNKSGYYTKAGYVAPGTKIVKIRRRNSMNPRALSRAVSRINGAKGIQSTLHEIETAKYTKAGNKKD